MDCLIIGRTVALNKLQDERQRNRTPMAALPLTALELVHYHNTKYPEYSGEGNRINDCGLATLNYTDSF